MAYLKGPEKMPLNPKFMPFPKWEIHEGDPSLDFYNISWNDLRSKTENSIESDFISEYAMTSPFEDFAESYTYYIQHNKSFLEKIKTSLVLLKKFEFLKNKVFMGKTFDIRESVPKESNKRIKHVDHEPFDLSEFLKLTKD